MVGRVVSTKTPVVTGGVNVSALAVLPAASEIVPPLSGELTVIPSVSVRPVILVGLTTMPVALFVITVDALTGVAPIVSGRLTVPEKFTASLQLIVKLKFPGVVTDE